MSEQLNTITTVDGMKALEQYLVSREYVGLDTETTGVDKDSHIIGFSLCADVDSAYYVVLSYWNKAAGELVSLETLGYAAEFLGALRSKKLICHNAVFDCFMVSNNFGVELMPSVHTDTMILAHLLDENRRVGLKELGVSIFGETSKQEQIEMHASVTKNGGQLTKACYELYKADYDLLAKYGAKDALLTLKIFYHLVPDLYEQGLNKFFYEDESMPLLRGPTYQLNTIGLRVDQEKLEILKKTLEVEIMETKALINNDIDAFVKDKYKGKSPSTTFNLNASAQLCWLMYFRLENEFRRLTDVGKEVCLALGLKVPYSPAAKREFIDTVIQNKGRIYGEAKFNHKTGKMSKPKKVRDPWFYIACGKESLQLLAPRYRWIAKLLELKKNEKLLSTYVLGIQSRVSCSIIRPQFLQHGTTSGRYSSKTPNFQNLPREDKRIKSCIISRRGKVFVGADYAQLEPRVFASTSQDATLCDSFARGEDFYSVVGAPIFGVSKCSMFKNDVDSFAKLYPQLRDKSKVIALATPYGRTAFQQAAALDVSPDASAELIASYFDAYPKVEAMMLESHEMAKRDGVVYNLFGRPRRIPEAKTIPELYGNARHAELPYVYRQMLNLAMNHRVQSTAASIMNRAAIAVVAAIKRSLSSRSSME